jgi:hypothetical protein
MRKLVLAFLFACSPAFANDFQDIWWDTSKGGMGIIVGQQGSAMFVSWFTYDPSALGTWYLFSGNLQTATVNGATQKSVAGQLLQYSGTPPQTYNPAASNSRVVGSATLTFTSPLLGTLNYTLNGINGSMNLQRFNFAAVVPDGLYTGVLSISASGCTFATDNGTGSNLSTFNISTSGSAWTMLETAPGYTCTFKGTYSQAGTKYSVSGGNFNCSTGTSGTWASSDFSIHDVFLTGQFTQQYTVGETCQVVGNLALVNGSKQPAALK